MRWGILGTGKIAAKFATQLRETEDQTLAAAGSRTAASADAFAAQHGGVAHTSYQQLLDDPGIDCVYVSLPNSMHREWTIAALRAGKHVLCEKPLASTRDEAEAMFDEAEKQGRVLVEAFMYRTQPIIQRLLKAVDEGAVGEVKIVRSHFTYEREPDPHDVRYQADLDGGSLMDVGCYCLNLIRAVTRQEPHQMQALHHQHPFGVDDLAAGLLAFPSGALGVFTSGMTVQADRTTFIGGQDGFIRIDTPWFSEGSFDIVRPDGVETVRAPNPKGAYALEAEAFTRVVRGEEEPWITREDSLGNMRVLDALRSQFRGSPT